VKVSYGLQTMKSDIINKDLLLRDCTVKKQFSASTGYGCGSVLVALFKLKIN
jgi:hypothetical protein